MREEEPPAPPARQLPEPVLRHPRAPQQERERLALAVALRDRRALGVHDQREQVLPQRDPLAQGASVAPELFRHQVRTQALDPDAHEFPLQPFSISSSAMNQSAAGASTTRSVCPPFVRFAGHTSTQVPQPMQRS